MKPIRVVALGWSIREGRWVFAFEVGLSREIEIECSAPGKLYLFGEYAVLAGGWSVVSAVGRRVVVRRYREAGEYRVVGADFGDESLVEAVLAQVAAGGDEGFTPGHFESDVSQLYERGRKLGLGSSAASCVALTGAAMAESGADFDDDSRRRALPVAERAHTVFQGGQGSGGAVAAACLGGTLAVRRRGSTAGFVELGDVGAIEDCERVVDFEFVPLRMQMPDGLSVRAFWLGEPASTTSFVDRVLRETRRDPAPVYRQFRKISTIAKKAIDEMSREDTAALLETFRAGDEAMERLGELCEVPIVTDRHRRLREVAESAGAVAKPSGAGGGDFSLVVGDEATDWERIGREIPESVESVELEFGAKGLAFS